MKKTYQNINLNCSFQQSEELSENQCLSGLFSKNADGSFTFEEVIPRRRDIRNAKLFEGQYLSVVRMKNGKLQFHMKTLAPDFNASEFALQVSSEISKALENIQ